MLSGRYLLHIFTKTSECLGLDICGIPHRIKKIEIEALRKQKPQAALWCFVTRSRGHKASWQIQKNRQLFGRIVAGSTSAKDCPAVNLSHAPAKKKRGGSVC